MPAYTSSIPDHLIEKVAEFSRELKIPKNQIIQKALEIYLRELDKAAFAADFRRLRGDKDLRVIAEEGMSDYMDQLNKWDETE